MYEKIISIKNLCEAWQEFVRGKKNKKDVTEFSLNLSHNIFNLYRDLLYKTYEHGAYESFSINDPKPRSIHKAAVRDRLLHHAIYRVLYQYFEKKFVYDSYSCRNFKGTHKSLERFKIFFQQVSKSKKITCWVLKCDIRKFFATIDHKILIQIIEKYIEDKNVLWLLGKVINSFSVSPGKGLPLGNLTSQLLVNIYMNEFDQFIKHEFKIKHYARYADDFVILHHNRRELVEILPKVKEFLQNNLKLGLHPDKVFIKTFSSGVDFLGWVHFPYHRVLRTVTKRRMLKKLTMDNSRETISSYLGMLKWGNGYKLQHLLEKL